MKRLQNAACLASFRNRIPLAIVLVVASVRHCRAMGELRHTLTLVNGQILAIGGGTFLAEDHDPRINAFILSLTGRPRPRVCYLGTAAAIKSTACAASTAP